MITYLADDEAYRGSVWVAFGEGLEWRRELVESVSGPLGLTLDLAAQPHVVYAKQVPAELWFAARTADGWQRELVDSATPSRGALGLDSGARTHVAYTTSTDQLKYAVKDGGAWDIETITSGAVLWVDMTLDAQETPHIVYKTGTGQDIGYATRHPDGTWAIRSSMPAAIAKWLSTWMHKAILT